MAQGELTITLSDQDYERVKSIMQGLTELQKSAVIQKGLQEGTRVLVVQGKQNLMTSLSKDPVNVKARKGNLERSFTTRTKKNRLSGYAGFKRPGGASAHLVDKGTDNRWTKSGAYRGSVSKKSPYTGSRFWTRAVETQSQNALNTLVESIEKSIDKIVQNGGRVS